MTINRRDLALSTLPSQPLPSPRLLSQHRRWRPRRMRKPWRKRSRPSALPRSRPIPKALGALCADEVSYSHSNGKVEDKATFVTNATDGKSKFLSIEYKDPTIKVVGPAAIVRFHWMGEQEMAADGKSIDQSSHPDELAEAGRRLEAAVARRNEVVMASYPLPPVGEGEQLGRRP